MRLIPRYITKVTDYEGRVLEEDFPDAKDVISSRTARVMTRNAAGSGAARNGRGRIRVEAAARRKDWHDQRLHRRVVRRIFSDRLTCGVWIGYDEKEDAGRKRKRRTRRASHVD